MKKVIIVGIMVIFISHFLKGQNVLDTIQWDPEEWSRDDGKTEVENLNDLLTILATEASNFPDLKCIETHFNSVKMLVEAYPPTTEMVNDLIRVYSNYDAEGGIHKYINGAKQLLIAYEYKPGTVSFIVYNLPEAWDPGVSYPLYVWGKEAGRLWSYPKGVHVKLQEQIQDGLLYRGPSSRFKDGYTLIPGSLGKGTFNADAEEDFLKGLDLFIDEFKTDKSKYYLGGFSQGAGATWNISTKEGMMEKYKFAALAMHAPSVNSERINSTFSSRVSDVPIWLSAGEDDGRYGGIAKQINSLITGEGYPPEVFYIEPGKAHTWTQTLQGNMCYFFQKHQRLMPGNAPPAPTALTKVEAGERQVKISWTDNSNNELQFVIKRKLKGELEFSEIAMVAPDVDYFVDKKVVSGTTYYYKVCAYNASGMSGATDELEIITPGESISNVALFGRLEVSDESSEDNGENLIDGHTLGTDMYRWNASGFPQWAEIDLKTDYDISLFKIFAYDNREYLYKIEAKSTDGEYVTVVDRTETNKSAPAFIDEVDITARYVKLTVTGALIYAGSSINISEFEIYGRMVGQVDVTGVSLKPGSLELKEGESFTLVPSISPEDASIQTINWFSDNEDVAIVYRTGMVKAIAPGTANIIAVTQSGGETAICPITVSAEVHATGVTISQSIIEMNVGGDTTLTAEVVPENAVDKSVTWSSDNTSVATVDDAGNVTGLSTGSATIIAKTNDGEYTATCKVNVNDISGMKTYKNSQLSVYPNPVINGKFSIELRDNQTSTISLLSLDGKIVKLITVKSEKVEISMADLNKGVYFLKVKSGDEVSQIKLIND